MVGKNYLLALPIYFCILEVMRANDKDIKQFFIQIADYTSNFSQSISEIAVVGAGIANASVTYRFHQKTRLRLPLDMIVIDICSKGKGKGHIKSIRAHDDPVVILEARVVALSDDYGCLKKAMQKVNLKPEYNEQFDHRTDIRHCDEFLMTYQNKTAPDAHLRRQQQRVNWFWKYDRKSTRFCFMVEVAFEYFHSFAMFPSQ